MFIQYRSFNKLDEKSDTGSKFRTIGKFRNKKGSSSTRIIILLIILYLILLFSSSSN